MQDDLDAFLGDGRIVDEAAGSKALDVVEGEFQREADKLGLPSNADEEISGSCLASLHFFWRTAACWNPVICICMWVGATQELINKIVALSSDMICLAFNIGGSLRDVTG
jgi:hypothetical protein